MAALPDGEYILTERVESPLPTRLHSRRCGWMRASAWPKDTRFTIVNGVWQCSTMSYGSRRGARLSDRHRRLVFVAVRTFLVPWAPALPSQFLGYCDGNDVLDFLVTTGRLTLDEVREAHALHNVGSAIGDALEAFHAAPVAAPIAAPAPAGPATLRVGDVIECGGGNGPRWAAIGVSGPEFLWQSAEGCPPFADRHRTDNEPVIGHVADMLAEGLAALSIVANRGPSLGVATGNVQPIPVYAGDILIADGNRDVRVLVLGAAPSDKLGPRVRVAQLRGGDSLDGSISLQPGNGWVHEDRSVLGYDYGGAPVRVGDVLRSVKDPPGHPHSVRLLVTGPAPQDGHGPCTSFKRLDGPIHSFDRVSLRPGNGWSVEAPPQIVAPSGPAPQNVLSIPRSQVPRRETSAFTLDDRDPFTLD
jgi:hypothetical protein